MPKQGIFQPLADIISFILGRYIINPDLLAEIYSLAIGIAIAIVLQFVIYLLKIRRSVWLFVKSASP